MWISPNSFPVHTWLVLFIMQVIPWLSTLSSFFTFMFYTIKKGSLDDYLDVPKSNSTIITTTPHKLIHFQHGCSKDVFVFKRSKEFLFWNSFLTKLTCRLVLQTFGLQINSDLSLAELQTLSLTSRRQRIAPVWCVLSSSICPVFTFSISLQTETYFNFPNSNRSIFASNPHLSSNNNTACNSAIVCRLKFSNVLIAFCTRCIRRATNFVRRHRNLASGWCVGAWRRF